MTYANMNFNEAVAKAAQDGISFEVREYGNGMMAKFYNETTVLAHAYAATREGACAIALDKLEGNI